MAVTLFIPYIAVQPNGVLVQTSAPTVDSLTSAGTGTGVVLTNDVGVYAAGGYQWIPSRNRWQFTIDYQTICGQVFGVSQGFVATPNPGDTLIPIGSSGAATVVVRRNGVIITTYTLNNLGVVLNIPASLGDVYVIIQYSPLTATTAIGVTDAPIDGNAYVRKNAAWENLQAETNEGLFTGQ
jgi:hypothetical protein